MHGLPVIATKNGAPVEIHQVSEHIYCAFVKLRYFLPRKVLSTTSWDEDHHVFSMDVCRCWTMVSLLIPMISMQLQMHSINSFLKNNFGQNAERMG